MGWKASVRVWLSLFGFLLSAGALSVVQAATYNLPAAIGSAPFASCALTTGSSYSCTGSISILAGDIVNVTSAMTLNVAGSVTVNNNATLGTSGQTLNIIAGGSITVVNNAVVTANLTLTGFGAFSITNGSVVTGNISSTNSSLLITNSAKVYGNVGVASITAGGGSVVGNCVPANAVCATSQSTPLVTTAAASNITTTGVTLNGSVTPNMTSATAKFNYGTTTAYGTTVTSAQSPLASSVNGTAVTALLTGLSCNTLYHFRVTATNTAGTSNGGDQTFTTSACATTVSSIIMASTNPTTTGASVTWTVTFNQNATGVTAANFSLISTGVSGATITSVTGAGSIWTVSATTGSGNGQLGLNMVNVAGVLPSVSSTMPFVGQVYTVYPVLTCLTDVFTGVNNASLNTVNWDVQKVSGTFTPLISSNRMRITDISNNVATRVTNKNLFPFGNNLVVAEFDYWAYGGSGADGVAITFSDPDNPTIGGNVSPTAGGFGGSLGYANRDNIGMCNVAGFTSGWLGVGIDEYGNYSNPNECRNGGTGFFPDAVAMRGSGSGVTSPSISNYAFLTGTGTLAGGVSSNISTTAYRYRITLDSITDLTKVMVKVEQDKTGSGASYLPLLSYDLKPLITAGTQAALPSQLQFTITGSTGAATNYHEVDNLSICAASIVKSLNHFVISAATTAAAATSTAVTVAPHDASHAYIAGGTIYLSSSTGKGNWNIGTAKGTLTAGAANSGLATYTFANGETSATLGFTYPSAATVTLNVQNATGGDWLANTPVGEKANVVIFTVPSFVFTNAACAHNIAFGANGQTCSVMSWSPQVAGQNSANVYITAVNASGVPTRFSRTATTTNSMQYGLSCYDPLAGAGKVPTFSATTGIFSVCQSNAAQPTTWTTAANITFPIGSPSAGPFIFNYPDVGKVELWARDSVVTTQTGSSGSFVVKPGGFVLSAIKRSSDNFTNPAAANSSGTAFVKAGEAFSVAVAATTCTPVSATCTVAGITTPNYGQETTPESVKLTPSNVIAGMATPPSISGSFGLFTAGVATGTAFSWSEVGIITLTPSISDANYFNNGDVTGAISGNVGRFYPDHFDTIITGPLPCLLTLVCPTGGSAYSGQPFTANVYAKNATDGTVTNYNSVTGFSRQVTLSAWDTLGSTTTQNPPAATSSALSGVIAASAFTSGSTALGSPGTPAYTFGVTPTIPTDIYIRANDADGVTSLRTSSTSVEGGIKVVSGRIKISNAVGSELLPLTVSATLQYYNTNIWTTNLADSVSTMTLAGSYNAIKNGVIIGTTTPVPTGVVTFTGGKKSIVLGKPTGAGTVTLNPSVPSYLPLTPGTVTFGVYQGRKEFIYLRENY